MVEEGPVYVALVANRGPSCTADEQSRALAGKLKYYTARIQTLN